MRYVRTRFTVRVKREEKQPRSPQETFLSDQINACAKWASQKWKAFTGSFVD